MRYERKWFVARVQDQQSILTDGVVERDVPGRYTSVFVTPRAVTGFTSRSEPTSHWSSIAKVAESAGYSNHIGRIVGAPVMYAS
jgi:hypothetical protein